MICLSLANAGLFVIAQARLLRRIDFRRSIVEGKENPRNGEKPSLIAVRLA